MASNSKFTLQQWYIDQLLVCEQVEPKIKERFVEKEGWTEHEFKKLVYACYTWRRVAKAKTEEEKEAFFQRSAGVLTLLFRDPDLYKAVMPNRLSMVSDGDTKDYLSQANIVDRKDMGECCLNSEEFRKFQHKIKDIVVTRANIA